MTAHPEPHVCCENAELFLRCRSEGKNWAWAVANPGVFSVAVLHCPWCGEYLGPYSLGKTMVRLFYIRKKSDWGLYLTPTREWTDNWLGAAFAPREAPLVEVCPDDGEVREFKVRDFEGGTFTMEDLVITERGVEPGEKRATPQPDRCEDCGLAEGALIPGADPPTPATLFPLPVESDEPWGTPPSELHVIALAHGIPVWGIGTKKLCPLCVNRRTARMQAAVRDRRAQR